MGQRPERPDIRPIERQDQLVELCNQCRAEGRFAFDTEFVMEDRFEAEVCLVQIATRDSAAIIDPFLPLDLAPVWDLVCDDQVETVVHAGGEDLGIAFQHTGRVPRCVYDVQIAAGLAGHDYPLSLQKLAQGTLHVRLHKSKTLTDWRKRPLSEAHVHYGVEDVCYLLAIRERIHERLSQRNRLGWAREEFERFEDMSLYRRAEEDKLTRLKGTGALRGRQLAVVRELLTWREGLAKRYNRPIRAVLKDHLLVEIAKHELCMHHDVRELRGLNLGDRDVRSLCQVVQAAVRTPEETWPKPALRDTETPREAALIALITAVLRGFCLEGDLSYGLVASKKSIRELIRQTLRRGEGDAEAELLTGWRREAVGKLLEEVLTGRGVVCVDRIANEQVVRVVPKRE